MASNINLYLVKSLITTVAIGMLTACGNELKKNDKLNLLQEYEEIEKTELASDLILNLLQRDTAGIPNKLKYKIKVSIYKPNKQIEQKSLKEISRIIMEKNNNSHFKLRSFIDSLQCHIVFNLILDKELRLTSNSSDSIKLITEDIYILGDIIEDKRLMVYSRNSVDVDWGVGYIQLFKYIGRDSILREFDRRLWIK